MMNTNNYGILEYGHLGKILADINNSLYEMIKEHVMIFVVNPVSRFCFVIFLNLRLTRPSYNS